MVLGQEPKIYLFLGVYSAEDILRLRDALCFFVFFDNGCKQGLHRLKKILKQAGKQRVFILVSCVDRPRCDTCFFGNLVHRSLLKTISKKLRVCSLNDPIIQGMIPIGHVFTPLHLNNNIIIDNDIIIAFFLLLVNANCTLRYKNKP